MSYFLELFYYPSCPYCVRVLRFLKEKKIKLKLINIHEEEDGAKRLYRDTGRMTVPCLYINNTPLFESLDIIKWLDEHITELEENS